MVLVIFILLFFRGLVLVSFFAIFIVSAHRIRRKGVPC